MFHGIITALVTPFAGGKIDEKAFSALVEWQVAEGVHGLAPCGTTGETPTLSRAERRRVVELCKEAASGKVKLMAGTGSNNTEECIELTREAKALGMDAALIAAPYYNKPTQEGLYQHYKAVHDAVDLPIILYNVPGRSAVTITNDTIARLAKLPRIIALKDATGDLARPVMLAGEVPHDFTQLSGEDMTMVPFNAAGGKGCISVLSNVAPRLTAQVQEACLKGDYTAAAKLFAPLVALSDAMFCETNPGPAKYALEVMGKGSADMRLPLVRISEASQKKVQAALRIAGIA